MLATYDFHKPEKPMDGEEFNYVSVQSHDPSAAVYVLALYRAFTARYEGEDPMLAFLEWILIQLDESPSAERPFVFTVGIHDE